jgi:hypothetical protein
VSCVEFENADALESASAVDCSWTAIIAGIRQYARSETPEVAADLNAWADLLEGIASLDRGGSQT